MRALRFLTLISLVLCGACGEAPLTDVERRSIAASIDSATRAFEAAERTRDPERVIAHLAPDFYMYMDGVRADYSSTTAQIRGTLGTFQYLEPGFADIEVTVLGRDGAMASLTFQDSMVDASGATLQFRGATTLVWERRGTDWLITYADADHYPAAIP